MGWGRPITCAAAICVERSMERALLLAVFCRNINRLRAFVAETPHRLHHLRNARAGEEMARRGPSSSQTQKPTWPNHRLPLTAFETHNGRSTFAAGTAFHAPKRTLRNALVRGAPEARALS